VPLYRQTEFFSTQGNQCGESIGRWGISLCCSSPWSWTWTQHIGHAFSCDSAWEAKCGVLMTGLLSDTILYIRACFIIISKQSSPLVVVEVMPHTHIHLKESYQIINCFWAACQPC